MQASGQGGAKRGLIHNNQRGVGLRSRLSGSAGLFPSPRRNLGEPCLRNTPAPTIAGDPLSQSSDGRARPREQLGEDVGHKTSDFAKRLIWLALPSGNWEREGS
jgi:hypothetical protein